MAALAACYMMMFTVFGIAFSSNFRCVLLITLPYLAASRTRWLLMLIATTLATTGPALNFMHNSGNFRNAIACVLGQVGANVELIGKITRAPLKIIMKQLSGSIDSINSRLFAARMALRKLKEVIYMATKILNQKSDWIRAMMEACGDEIAMKNQCLAFFNTLYFNCAASMKSMSFLCNLVRMFADQACNGVAKLNNICVRESNRLHLEMTNMAPVTEEQLQDSEASILRFLGHENISFEVGEEITDISFGMNVSSKAVVTTMIEEKMDFMMNELNRFKRAMAWVVTTWTLLTMIQLIVQAALYRKKWLKKAFFDNGHITPQFVEQERKALEHGRPTAIPLTRSESMNYVTLTACRWSRTERNTVVGSLVFLIVGMITLVLIIFADYAMYQVVLTASPAFSAGFGGMQQTLEEGMYDQVLDLELSGSERGVPEIRGNSTMSEIGRSFLNLANPLRDVALNVDASICRPQPSEPDHKTAILIGLALVLTLFSIIVQIYVLRLRHLILAWYYPDGASRRAAWLRTYIQNTRGLFHQLIHKLFNQKLAKNVVESSSCRLKRVDRFIFMHPRLARHFAMVGLKRIFCAQCTAPGNPKKKSEFQQNFTPCPRCGVHYCKLCQVDLGGICMYCNVPVYTLSNVVDFENWSSDEEYDYFYVKYFSRKKNDEFMVPLSTLSLEETLPPKLFRRILQPFRFIIKSRLQAVKRPELAWKLGMLIKRRRARGVDKGVMIAQPTTLPSLSKSRLPRLKQRRRPIKVIKWDFAWDEEERESGKESLPQLRSKGVQTPLVRLSVLDCGSFSAREEDIQHIGSFRFSAPPKMSVKVIGDLEIMKPTKDLIFPSVGRASVLKNYQLGNVSEEYEHQDEKAIGFPERLQNEQGDRYLRSFSSTIEGISPSKSSSTVLLSTGSQLASALHSVNKGFGSSCGDVIDAKLCRVAGISTPESQKDQKGSPEGNYLAFFLNEDRSHVNSAILEPVSSLNDSTTLETQNQRNGPSLSPLNTADSNMESPMCEEKPIKSKILIPDIGTISSIKGSSFSSLATLALNYDSQKQVENPENSSSLKTFESTPQILPNRTNLTESLNGFLHLKPEEFSNSQILSFNEAARSDIQSLSSENFSKIEGLMGFPKSPSPAKDYNSPTHGRSLNNCKIPRPSDVKNLIAAGKSVKNFEVGQITSQITSKLSPPISYECSLTKSRGQPSEGNMSVPKGPGKSPKRSLLVCEQQGWISKLKFSSQVSDFNPQGETKLNERNVANRSESVTIGSEKRFRFFSHRSNKETV
ncbi:DC-STAMP domain-containing protein 2 [Taenia solium]|eukprot:TsM_000775900 transcript=TsM_000775900 gene=TsM_000775900